MYDPDGEITSYAWSDGRSTREVDRTVDLPAGETFAFSVRVTDDDGATATFRKSVRVLAPGDGTNAGSTTADSNNEAPTARIDGPDRVASGHDATFILRGSDPDGSLVRRLWPDRSENGAVVDLAFTETGTHTLRGVVVDDDGARTTAMKTVEVYDEGPPVVSIDGPDSATAGSTQEYTLEAYDPDGGELTITWDPGQTQLERESSRFVNNVGIEGNLGETMEISATVTDDEGNTVTAVKETEVETQTSFGTGESVPHISEISWRYATDDTKQTPETDSVELSTYEFFATVTHEEPKIVRATWRVNDTNRAVIVDTLGRFSGTRDTEIRHIFVSEHGGKVTREVSLSAVDADGDRGEQKWISRVHSVQTHDDIVFYAMKSGVPARKTSLEVEPGDQVEFTVGSNQNYRLAFGDGNAARGSGTSVLRNVEIAHTYDDPGTYKARLISTQGPNGEALKTIDINVRPKTYTEYWYESTTNTIERVISEERPSEKAGSKNRYTTPGRTLQDGRYLCGPMLGGHRWSAITGYRRRRALSSDRAGLLASSGRIRTGQETTGSSWNETFEPRNERTTKTNPGGFRVASGVRDGVSPAKPEPSAWSLAMDTTTTAIDTVEPHERVRTGISIRARTAGSHGSAPTGTMTPISGTPATTTAGTRTTT
ncbi:PKD domain-containing protein [Halobaculum halobium]|uniref:PKD domain-containing protein n=1 Tax=Halobaculum halobium TaxID=3032281 RepID=UPI0036182784